MGQPSTPALRILLASDVGAEICTRAGGVCAVREGGRMSAHFFRRFGFVGCVHPHEFWIRRGDRGAGLAFKSKQVRPLFSERNGYRRVLLRTPWFRVLKLEADQAAT